MGILYVTEFPEDRVRGEVAKVTRGMVDQTPVTFSASAQSAAFAATTVLVRIQANATCSVAFGTNPTATTNNFRMVADQTEYFGVPVGASYKVAAIANT